MVGGCHESGHFVRCSTVKAAIAVLKKGVLSCFYGKYTFSQRSCLFAGQIGLKTLKNYQKTLKNHQKTLKNGIYSFPAWRSAFMGRLWRTSRQVRLLCPWARHLTGCPRLYVEDRWPINLEKGNSQASADVPSKV